MNFNSIKEEKAKYNPKSYCSMYAGQDLERERKREREIQGTQNQYSLLLLSFLPVHLKAGMLT